MFQILTVIQSVAFMRRARRGHSSKFQQASAPIHQKEARPAEKSKITARPEPGPPGRVSGTRAHPG